MDEMFPEFAPEITAQLGELDREATRAGVVCSAIEAMVFPHAAVEGAAAAAAPTPVGLDLPGLLGVLREMPDGAGTDRFLLAFREHTLR